MHEGPQDIKTVQELRAIIAAKEEGSFCPGWANDRGQSCLVGDAALRSGYERHGPYGWRGWVAWAYGVPYELVDRIALASVPFLNEDGSFEAMKAKALAIIDRYTGAIQ